MKYIDVPIIVYLILFFSTKVMSLSCGEVNIKEEFNHAERVFIGQCIGIQPNFITNCSPPDIARGIQICSTIDSSLYTFKIYKGYKGVHDYELITMYYPCYISVKKGRSYLVFSHRNDDYYFCSNRRQLNFNPFLLPLNLKDVLEKNRTSLRSFQTRNVFHQKLDNGNSIQNTKQFNWTNKHYLLSLGAITFVFLGLWMKKKS